ncbi:MAG TPA: hypothetical protein VMT43_13910, partial [Acidimicrobiales bacterium]|nr:hypothetical protein [Acidimicrobiales bacterium]
ATAAVPGPPWAWWRWVLVIVAGAIGALLRTYPAAQRFAIASEDGVVFTKEARALGVLPSIVRTYAGYFHLVPRVTAAVASALPLSRTPLVYGWVAALFAGTCAAIAARSARGMGLSVLSSTVIGVVVLCLPASGWETAMWLTNLEWYVIATFVVFAAAWIGGYDPPMHWAVPLLIVAGLTSPLLMVSLPFLLVAAWVRHRRRDLVVPGVVAVTGAVHLVGRAFSNPRGSGHWTLGELVRMYSVRVVGGALAGANGLARAYDHLGSGPFVALAVVVVVVLAVLGLRATSARRLVLLYLLYASLVYVAVAVVVRPAFFARTLPVGLIVRDGRQTWWNLRYMAAPTVALTTAAVVLADGWLRARATLARVAAIVVYVAIAVVTVVNVPVYLHRDTLEHWYQGVSAAKAHCQATHGRGATAIPYGLFTHPPAFKLVLTCHQAFG